MTQDKRISADIGGTAWHAVRQFKQVPGRIARYGIGVRLQQPEGR